MEKMVGLGTDMTEIDRVKKAYEKDRFREKYFTKKEQELIAIKQSRVASHFAAKEAVAKAFGTGFREFMPIDIEILRDELGAPMVQLSQKADNVAKKKGITKILLSISDTSEHAIATAIAISEEAI